MNEKAILFAIVAGFTLPACTFTNEAFEPDSVVSELGASGAGAVDDTADAGGMAAVAPPYEPGSPCLDGGIRTCGDIDLAPPIGSEPSDPGETPAVEPSPSLALPTCTGVWSAFGPPERVTGIELDTDLFAPSLSADGKTLYFASGGQLYTVVRTTRGTVFGGIVELSVLDSAVLEGTPFITADDLSLYFFSDRTGDGAEARDIWLSQRAGQELPFGPPRRVAEIESAVSDLAPWLAQDELSVLFVSDRPGGLGGADVWQANRRRREDPFGEPVPLSELASTANEGRAALSADGRTVFFSSARDGNYDIWTSTRRDSSGAFEAPTRLDTVNGPALDIDVMLSVDQSELFFASSRDGLGAIFRSERRCE
ncbi:MAG: hypothetical protein ABW217_10570 [Polyangiaceae bacterium]